MHVPKNRTTTEAGYGWTHQKARAAAVAAHRDGAPCPMCGRPMFKADGLHLDHETPIALGGTGGDGRLVHARCNMSHGGRLSGRLRRARRVARVGGWVSPTGLRTSQQWAPEYRWVGPGRPPAGTALGS